MNITDLFIRRPILSLVVSLLILVLGLRSVFSLPVNQYPKTKNSTISITTAYPGADAQTVSGFITQPIEAAVAQAQGIDYLSSSSSSGVSTITATLLLNYDSSKALTEITTLVNSVRNQMPAAAQQSTLTVSTGSTLAALYIGFYSKTLPSNNLTDYLQRVVKPKFNSIAGVQSADILGGRPFAMRIWLDQKRMAAYNLTALDVRTALTTNNYLSALGSSKGDGVSIPLVGSTDLHSAEEFKQLVVKQSGDQMVRLSDVATIVLGSQDYNFNVAFNGVSSVFMGIKGSPDANIITVAEDVHKAFPEIQAQLPQGITSGIVYDSTEFINTSIEEVIKTLVEALVIVTLVIFIFLGSFRAVLVPVIAMPLSLIGAFALMLALGYSINLLTLLALVLGIGLVVDDAIIVVEDVDRHMKLGKSPLQAALQAGRDLASPIISMTIVVMAVYVPIGFQGGITGALFTEFAFTLAGAVLVSGVIALTLSPMMASRIFKEGQEPSRFAKFIDHQFEKIQTGYRNLLANLLGTWPVLVVFAALIMVCTGIMFKMSQSELAPSEDQGFILTQISAPPTTTASVMKGYAGQAFDIAKQIPEYKGMFQLTGTPAVYQGIAGHQLKDWAERSRTATQVQQDLQKQLSQIAGVKVAAFQPASLPGGSGLPVQFVIKSTEPFENMNEVAQEVLKKATADRMFYFVDADLKYDQPQSKVVVDKDKVAALGMSLQDVGAALGSALGGAYVNYFSIAGRAYQVIPQVLQTDRLNPSEVLNFQMKSPRGMVPLGTVAHIENIVVPESINHFQQMNSVTISGVSGSAQGDILSYLKTTLESVAPSGYTVDYAGSSRQFMSGAGGFLTTMLFAIIIVFLVLAAQFESFRDPIVILSAVPLALFGAVMFIFLGFTSINIYTQVGLVTLVGLISKHGILMVEVATERQRAGLNKLDAILDAAATRFRPILMTTFAMVFGVFPLVIASGAGAAGRYAMGLVIFTGLAIGTLFTLFVVPAMYMFIGATHAKEGADSAETILQQAVRT